MTSDKKRGRYSSVIPTIIIAIVLALTIIFGLKEIKLRSENESTTQFEITKVTSALSVSNSDSNYKINEFYLFEDEADLSLKRAEINLEEETFENISTEKLKSLCNFVRGLSEYEWTTVKLKNNTGIVCTSAENKTLFYGTLSKNGLISDIYGYVVQTNECDYVFVSNNTADSENVEEYANESTSAQNKTVYITAYGKKYHTENCSYLTESKYAISLSEAKEKGYSPCSRCKP